MRAEEALIAITLFKSWTPTPTIYPLPWENATLFKDAEVIWASFTSLRRVHTTTSVSETTADSICMHELSSSELLIQTGLDYY